MEKNRRIKKISIKLNSWENSIKNEMDILKSIKKYNEERL
tara:strand:+ start:176 stop:295 length:120 start_codon:yes stop_codon:yes gene_type:complete